MRAAERKAWLYVSRLHETVTVETITRFLQRNGIQDNIECEQLKTMGKNKAFKLGIPFSHYDKTQEEEFWPQGLIIRRFNFRRTRWEPEAVNLENYQ